MLWIRTQARNRLIQVDDIYYDKDYTYDVYVINAVKGNDVVHLGEYDTEERCKEVFDSIEEYLLPDSILLDGRDSTGEKVFDMPEK